MSDPDGPQVSAGAKQYMQALIRLGGIETAARIIGVPVEALVLYITTDGRDPRQTRN